MSDSFPRQNARTRNFTLGSPRSFRVSPDGGTVVFLRSRGGSDPVTCLWAYDVATGEERLLADPLTLGSTEGANDPVERARRERVRERAAGIVAFSTDERCTVVAFVLAGVVYVADVADGTVRRLPTGSPAADPRPDPSGRLVAYVSEGALRVAAADGTDDRIVADPRGQAGVTFGLADFIAAEELERTRGYWWAPDSSAILVARVDETPVQVWHIADPANPAAAPAVARYPSAGTPNALVTLFVATLDGNLTAVDTDPQAFPYLISACWRHAGAESGRSSHPILVLASRTQQEMRVLSADPRTGATTLIRTDTDPFWVDVVAGTPDVTSDGRIVWTADTDGAKRLFAATARQHAAGQAAPLTPAELQVREVLGVDGEAILFRASGRDPACIAVWLANPDGLYRLTPDQGVHTAWAGGGTVVLASRDLDRSGADVSVVRPGGQKGWISSLAEQPVVPSPRPSLGYSGGPSRARTAVLLPSWHEPGSARLPVLCDPYGGPHSQRVTASADGYLSSQWFAEQGFAVVIADGRGTPGRGPASDRSVASDLATPALEDQVEALQGAAEQCQDLDLSRVAIRGWSFGGYLSALAVLRRPDVFHAAIAGAPVTDWRLYDTGYTERYLGLPDSCPEAYERSSLLADAARLQRPLMIIHGLADDNVVVAHSLRLSAALLAAGRPHTVLPLSGVTHMASQEEVAENLLLLQVDFLRSALDLGTSRPEGRT